MSARGVGLAPSRPVSLECSTFVSNLIIVCVRPKNAKSRASPPALYNNPQTTEVAKVLL